MKKQTVLIHVNAILIPIDQFEEPLTCEPSFKVSESLSSNDDSNNLLSDSSTIGLGFIWKEPASTPATSFIYYRTDRHKASRKKNMLKHSKHNLGNI